MVDSLGSKEESWGSKLACHHSMAAGRRHRTPDQRQTSQGSCSHGLPCPQAHGSRLGTAQPAYIDWGDPCFWNQSLVAWVVSLPDLCPGRKYYLYSKGSKQTCPLLQKQTPSLSSRAIHCRNILEKSSLEPKWSVRLLTRHTEGWEPQEHCLPEWLPTKRWLKDPGSFQTLLQIFRAFSVYLGDSERE